MKKNCISIKLKGLWEWLLNEVIPILGYWLAEKKILSDISDLKKRETLPEAENYKLDISLEVLEKCHNNEKERKKLIEEKAKANLLGITVGLTMITGAIGFLNGNIATKIFSTKYSWVLVVLLVMGIIFLLSGGVAALKALRINEYHDLYLVNEFSLMHLTKDVRKFKLMKCVELNQLITLIRVNYTDASYIGIRNGIICFAVFTLGIILTYFTSISNNTNNPLVGPTVYNKIFISVELPKKPGDTVKQKVYIEQKPALR